MRVAVLAAAEHYAWLAPAIGLAEGFRELGHWSEVVSYWPGRHLDRHAFAAARARLEALAPDLTVVLPWREAALIEGHLLGLARTLCPVVAWMGDDPYDHVRNLELAPYLDFVFTPQRELVEAYPRAAHLKAWSSGTVFQRRETTLRPWPVGFAGDLRTAQGARKQLVSRLDAWGKERGLGWWVCTPSKPLAGEQLDDRLQETRLCLEVPRVERIPAGYTSPRVHAYAAAGRPVLVVNPPAELGEDYPAAISCTVDELEETLDRLEVGTTWRPGCELEDVGLEMRLRFASAHRPAHRALRMVEVLFEDGLVFNDGAPHELHLQAVARMHDALGR